MERMFAIALALLTLVPAAVASQRTPASQAPHIQFVPEGGRLSSAQVLQLRQCRLVFRLKAGMTNAEANEAIDAGYQAFFDCLRKPVARGNP